MMGIAAPIQRGSVTEWATSGNVILPETVSQNDGRYSIANCEYMREVLEDFRDVTLSSSSLCFAAQVFKTTGMMVGLGYLIDQSPINAQWFMPNLQLLKSVVETKWIPIVDASPGIAKHKPKDSRKFKTLQQQFARMDLVFSPTGSEKNAKSRSSGVILLDEIDDIEAEWAKRGKSIVAMAESRAKSFAGSKIFKTSTPTVVTGAIWLAFIEGDQRLFFVHCPSCKKETTLEFSPEYTRQFFPDVPAARVVWGKEAGAPDARRPNGEWDYRAVAATARLKCPHCSRLITESEKIKAVRKGFWQPTSQKAEPGIKSRRLPSIYSPHPKTSIAALAVKYLKCFSKPGGLRNFMNEELALPFQPKGSAVTVTDVHRVAEHSPHYLLGEIPRANVSMLSLTVDVQQSCFWWVIRAWYSDAASSLVEYGQAVGWDELLALAARQFPIVGSEGRTAGAMFCLIDSGYRAKRTGGVYDFCLGPGAGRFFPCQGRAKGHGFLKTVAESDIDHSGRALKLIQFSDALLKYDLYISRIKERAAKNWWLPQNLGSDYEAQLTDEYLGKTKNARGYEEDHWMTKEDNNHLGDCEKMQLIMPSLLTPAGLKALYEKQAARRG